MDEWTSLEGILKEIAEEPLDTMPADNREEIIQAYRHSYARPAWGLSNAAATLTGQNLGAGNPDRAERSVWLTGFYNMIFLGVVAVVLILMPGPLVRVFKTDQQRFHASLLV